ncbi:hypothetical protein Esti_006634 [Eimeria stiedai]
MPEAAAGFLVTTSPFKVRGVCEAYGRGEGPPQGASRNKEVGESPAGEGAASAGREKTEIQEEAAAASPELDQVHLEPRADICCCSCSHEAADYLLLRCAHILCLPCGSLCMQQQAAALPTSLPFSLLCPLCSMETVLSDNVASTIIREPPWRVTPRERGHTTQAAATAATAAAADPLQQQQQQGPSAAAASAGAKAAGGGGGEGRRDSANGVRLSHAEWPLLCSFCEASSASVFCRDCIRAYCQACAIKAHTPITVSRSVCVHIDLSVGKTLLVPCLRGLHAVGKGDSASAARLASHSFSLLDRRGPSPPLPLTNPARAKLRELGAYRTLEDADCFLSLAEACMQQNSHEARLQQQQRQQQLEGLSEAQVAYTTVSSQQQQRQCSVSSIACDQHPQEPVRFFCQTCGGKCICAECALSGTHRRHLVLPAAAAWNEAAVRIESELGPSLERLESEVTEAQALLQDRRAEWIVGIDEDRELLSLTKQQLKKQLAAQQQETLESLASAVRSFSAECKGFRSFIEKKLSLLESKAQQVAEGRGSLDPSAVLAFLSDQEQQVQETLDADLPGAFEHLPHSRAALLEAMQQLTQNLLGELNGLRQKVLAAT